MSAKLTLALRRLADHAEATVDRGTVGSEPIGWAIDVAREALAPIPTARELLEHVSVLDDPEVSRVLAQACLRSAAEPPAQTEELPAELAKALAPFVEALDAHEEDTEIEGDRLGLDDEEPHGEGLGGALTYGDWRRLRSAAAAWPAVLARLRAEGAGEAAGLRTALNTAYLAHITWCWAKERLRILGEMVSDRAAGRDLPPLDLNWLAQEIGKIRDGAELLPEGLLTAPAPGGLGELLRQYELRRDRRKSHLEAAERMTFDTKDATESWFRTDVPRMRHEYMEAEVELRRLRVALRLPEGEHRCAPEGRLPAPLSRERR